MNCDEWGAVMLSALRVENFGIIQQAEISLTAGFTAVTGESGAGKSLLLTAVPAVLGLAGTADHVGPFAGSFRLRAAFSVASSHPLWTALRQWGIEEDDVLIVQRDMSREGRSIYRIQGQIVPRQAVRDLATELIDYSGQHHALRLFEPTTLLTWLDHYAQLNDLRDAVEAAYQQWRTAKTAWQELLQGSAKAEVMAEKAQEYASLKALGLSVDEESQLTKDLGRLRSRQQLLEGSQALSQIVDGAEGTSIIAQLDQARRQVEGLVRLDPSAVTMEGLIQQAQDVIDELRLALSEWASGLEQGPDRLEELEARANDLARVKRRYGMTIPEVLQYMQALHRDLQGWENLEWDLRVAERQAMEAEEAYRKVAEELSRIRKEAALSVSRRVSDLVHEMEMPHAVVTLRLEASEPSATGLDRASVVFASSAQQELRLANKVASGGELARIALAMAVLSGGRTDVTLIFDELDAGLGGESAARVGSLLQQLGKDHQVVAISHQPSVAARAADQWVVARTAEDTIVRALVKRVQGVEREREIARMLSGQVDSVAMGHARHLLGEGEEVD